MDVPVDQPGSKIGAFGVQLDLAGIGADAENDAVPDGDVPFQDFLGENIDDLCEITGFSVSELNIYLTEMELSGLIKHLSNGKYSV